jgi:hypothetical protein
MKKLLLAVVVLSIVEIVPCSVYAATETFGKPLNVYADPSDVVILLDTAGSCGTAFFHIRRTNANFKELTAVALTAFATGKRMYLVTDHCEGGPAGNARNILSHGAAIN